jgi:hypothetical protein
LNWFVQVHVAAVEPRKTQPIATATTAIAATLMIGVR